MDQRDIFSESVRHVAKLCAVAARKALIIAQASPELRARTYGAYYLIRDSIVTTGSFLGAWLWSISPRANFIGAAACGALGALWFWQTAFHTGRGRQRMEAPSSSMP